MQFMASGLSGAWLIEPEPHTDARGSFARTFCEREFAAQGLKTRFVQHSASISKKSGTLRGMHYQRAPCEEVKVVRCVRGAIYDVIIDLRSQSPSYRKWIGVELSQKNGRQLYVPEGFAHGFQTLSDDVEVHYLISEFYNPETSSGFFYNDPAFGIIWPGEVAEISEKDRMWPLCH